MSGSMRKSVLRAFKKLHRTREIVFAGDERALNAARAEINSHFQKNREVTDSAEIQKLIQLAADVDKELRTSVVQAVEKEPGVYELKLRDEIPRLDNVMFDPNAVVEKLPRDKRCGPNRVDKK